jgi:uncharacterized protein YukE
MRSCPKRPAAFVRRHTRLILSVCVVALVVVGTAAATTSRAAVAPTNSSTPTITGTMKTGNSVKADPGTWNGSAPITYQYQWQICGTDGNNCHAISGATSQTYTIQSGDAGNTLRVKVIGSNPDGSSSATSTASSRIAAAPSGPANTSPPTIAGQAVTGATATASPGTWTGTGTISYQYQWQICASNGTACHPITGATAQTYAIRSGDAGNSLRVTVIAADPQGSTSLTSAPTAQVASGSPAPSATGCPKTTAGASAVAVASITTPARLQVDQFQLVSGPITRNMQSFSARFHISDTCGQAVAGAEVYVTAVPYNQVTIPREATTNGSGWVTLTFNRLRGFPATSSQESMVLFVRAREPGQAALAGISTRRLVSLPVSLRG